MANFARLLAAKPLLMRYVNLQKIGGGATIARYFIYHRIPSNVNSIFNKPGAVISTRTQTVTDVTSVKGERTAVSWLVGHRPRPGLHDTIVRQSYTCQYSTLSSGGDKDAKDSALVKASWDSAKGTLTVYWRHLEEPSDFPLVWLRDCCQCENCVNKTGERTHPLVELNTDIKPRLVETKGDTLNIIWEDGHVSKYDADWLIKLRFVDSKTYRNPLEPEKKLWDVNFLKNPAKLKYEDVLKRDDHLLQWFSNIEVNGCCVLEDAPKDKSTVYKLSERIGCRPKELPYGPHFDVTHTSGGDERDVGYSAITLELHTELAMLENTCWVIVLHCISQNRTEGGVSKFSDGFKAAIQLREERPDYFELLTQPITFHSSQDTRRNFNFMLCAPVIKLDHRGEPCKIVFSNHFRTPLIQLPADQVKTFYEALKAFRQILYRPENLLMFRMKEGDIACVNNYRVLHGRTGWNKEAMGKRHIVTMYFDRDELISQRRKVSHGMNII